MAKSTAPPEKMVDLVFPKKGLDRSRAFGEQATDTTPLARNVRLFDPALGRARGGSRPGLSRYVDAIPGGTAGLIQDLNVLVGVGYTDPGGAAQSNSSGRIVNLVAVIGGKIYVLSAGGTAWVTANGQGSPLLNTTGVVRSTSLNQKLYFVDGTNTVVYDPSTNTASALVASAGTVPSGCRFICTYRGRLVLAGSVADPQNWFMSRVSDPTDWDYGNAADGTTTPDQAVAGNNGPLSIVGDVIHGVMPHTDDLLVFLCDSQLWLLAGDPMDGGSLNMISDIIGGAFGQAHCKGPDGTIYFMSNRGYIYAMEPGNSRPQKISQQIDHDLREINSGTHTVRLVWDEDNAGLHVFVTKTSESATATHYFREQDAGAWWETKLPNAMNPLACCVFDGNTPDDRVSLIGSWDGRIRAFSLSAATDDGEEIESYVAIGPLQTANMAEVGLKEVQSALGANSGDVNYRVYPARTAEEAIENMTADLALPDGSAESSYMGQVPGVFTAGREYTHPIRRSGYAIFLLLRSTERWQLEMIRAKLMGLGKIRQRGR